MSVHGYRLSERAYFEFVRNEYRPTPFEISDEDVRFLPGSSNAWINGQRFHLMLAMLQRHHPQSADPKWQAADIGLYPGTWINLARHFWSDIRWQGVGLCMSDRFREWAGQEEVPLHEVDIDPFYGAGPVARVMPFGTGEINLIVASEIFEHLISPLPFLEECSRCLKPGGLLLMTTPNVSHIGAVIRLLCGRSNYERLERSPMFLRDDEWRGHIRFYDRSELAWLADRYGFDVIEHRYYHDDYPRHVLRRSGIKPALMRWLRRAAGIIPWFRGGHILMLRRRS